MLKETKKPAEEMRIAIGVSGSGTTFEAIAGAINRGELQMNLAFIFADRPCGAIEKAKKLNIPVFLKIESETIDDFHQRLIDKMKKDKVDIVVLAGYLRLFPIYGEDPYLVINSHPAAIPDFGGAGFWGPKVHETVLGFAQKTNFRHPYTYSTIHVASAEYDRGDILGIIQMKISSKDTAEKIASRLLPLEHKNYIETLARLSIGQIQALENFDELVLPEEKEILKEVRQSVLKEHHG